VSDPGGSHGWRAGRHLPPRGGFGRIAERAIPGEDRPLCVLLLPEPLEELGEPFGRLATAPGVVAVDPPRMAYRRLPDVVADGLAAVQARRMRLPGVPYAIAIVDALQYPLARALIALHPDAELWYGGEGAGALHELATERAASGFDPSDPDVWTRMERLGIESGRLGSERPDIR
jgi:hypothetical protein